MFPLPQSLQPNMHFNMVRGSKTISSILKTTAWSAPSFMARSIKCFLSVCVPFFILSVVDYIISQENGANKKIYAAQSYPHIVVVYFLSGMIRGEESSVEQINSRNISWNFQGLVVE